MLYAPAPPLPCSGKVRTIPNDLAQPWLRREGKEASLLCPELGAGKGVSWLDTEGQPQVAEQRHLQLFYRRSMWKAGVPHFRDVVRTQIQHFQGKVGLQLTPLHAANLIVLPETHQGRWLEHLFLQSNYKKLVFLFPPPLQYNYNAVTLLKMRSPISFPIELLPAGQVLEK